MKNLQKLPDGTVVADGPWEPTKEQLKNYKRREVELCIQNMKFMRWDLARQLTLHSEKTIGNAQDKLRREASNASGDSSYAVLRARPRGAVAD